jgi:hypothetical protein
MAFHSHTIFGRAVDSVTAWLGHCRDVGELSRLSPAEFASIANDLRLSPLDLKRLADKGPGVTDNLSRMLADVGIDRPAIVRTEPAVMRDMERVCAACPNARRCRRELRAGTAKRTYREFCANSGTFDVLDQETAPASFQSELAEIAP